MTYANYDPAEQASRITSGIDKFLRPPLLPADRREVLRLVRNWTVAEIRKIDRPEQE